MRMVTPTASASGKMSGFVDRHLDALDASLLQRDARRRLGQRLDEIHVRPARGERAQALHHRRIGDEPAGAAQRRVHLHPHADQHRLRRLPLVRLQTDQQRQAQPVDEHGVARLKHGRPPAGLLGPAGRARNAGASRRPRPP